MGDMPNPHKETPSEESSLSVENAEAICEAEVLLMETVKDCLKPGIGLRNDAPLLVP